MAYIELAEFSKRLPDECPAIPPPLADRLMRDAIREFCRRSRAWTFVHEAFDLTTDVVEYPIADVPECAIIYDFVHVKINGEQAYPFSKSSLFDPTDKKRRHYNREGNTLLLVEIPDQTITDGILCESVLQPLPDACQIQEELFHEHIEIIEHLAKAMAMIRPGVPWTNLQLAAWHQEQYDLSIGGVSAHARAGGVSDRKHVRTHV